MRNDRDASGGRGPCGLARHAASPQFRARLLRALESQARPAVPGRRPGIAAVLRLDWPNLGIAFACGALITMAAGGVMMGPPSHDFGAHDVMSSHARSLLAGRLADMESPDRSRVAAWFQGKLDYPPRVLDLAAEGYQLVGGRMDYVDGQPVAAVVYRRTSHVINVFSCPRKAGAEPQRSVDAAGFHAVGWTHGPMQFWAVTDMEASELDRFVQALRAWL